MALNFGRLMSVLEYSRDYVLDMVAARMIDKLGPGSV